MRDIEEIGSILRRAIRTAKEEGIRIESGSLGSRAEGGCCALGALLLDDDPCIPSVKRYDRLEKMFQVPPGFAIELAFAFDDEMIEAGSTIPRWVEGDALALRELGRQLAIELREGLL